jgi:cullin 1
LKSVISSLVTLGIDPTNFKNRNLDVYRDCFEKIFLVETERFYKEQSIQFISNNPCTEYIKKALDSLQEEQERIVNYLDPETSTLLIPLVERVLITQHQEWIQEHFLPLLERDKVEDLKRMYLLFSRVPESLGILRDQFQDFVKKQGIFAMCSLHDSTINSEKEIDPSIYVEKLLGVYEKYNNITVTVFTSESGFQTSLDKACREFVNRNQISDQKSAKSAEIVSKYADQLLRKTTKLNEEIQIEVLLTGCITLFTFLEDKDVFQKFFTKHLAKRLVNGTSASEDAEASMISKLKDQCGFEYTAKLQRMFTDISISKDLNNGFGYVVF